mmetsp:Transcript_23429/g.44094  ORF Transcript_23429/g.44094 Transcript_23429/m.44094 type:complete len:307 (+) Transcript_23429:57-977(+)
MSPNLDTSLVLVLLGKFLVEECLLHGETVHLERPLLPHVPDAGALVHVGVHDSDASAKRAWDLAAEALLDPDSVGDDGYCFLRAGGEPVEEGTDSDVELAERLALVGAPLCVVLLLDIGEVNVREGRLDGGLGSSLVGVVNTSRLPQIVVAHERRRRLRMHHRQPLLFVLLRAKDRLLPVFVRLRFFLRVNVRSGLMRIVRGTDEERVVGGLEAPGEGTGADELHGIAPGGAPLGGVDDLVANGVPVAEADGDGLMDADDVERRVEEGGGLEVHVVVVVAGDAVSDKVDGLLGPLRDLRGGGLGTG